MLPRNQRLNLKKDFKWVASGKKLENKYMKLFVRVGENESPRIGIALSSKNFKKATERNRAKRLVSFAFETLYSKLPTNLSIVALPKASVLSVKSGEVVLELESLLRDEKIIS